MNRSLVTLVCTTSLLTAMSADAHGPAGHEETITPLQQKPLAGADGKQVIMVKVSYAPGKKSAAHTHPGPVYAYVLEGEVESQLGNEAPVVYHAGQSWYEAPGARHLVSRNASKTKPAELLVWMVKGDHEELILPLPSSNKP
jgi:quercetin dioxygenase-like cupin family protein